MSRLIDADALIRRLKPIREEEIRLYGRSGNKDCCTLSTALFEIEHAPVIEERKTGMWLPYLREGLTVKCSECGSRFDRPWHHCPNCGTDMRGNDNGSNDTNT